MFINHLSWNQHVWFWFSCTCTANWIVISTVSHRVGRYRKRYRQSTNADQKSIETMFSIAICRQCGDKWQSKALFLLFFDLRSSIVLAFSIAAYPVWVQRSLFAAEGGVVILTRHWWVESLLCWLYLILFKISNIFLFQSSTKCSLSGLEFTKCLSESKGSGTFFGWLGTHIGRKKGFFFFYQYVSQINQKTSKLLLDQYVSQINQKTSKLLFNQYVSQITQKNKQTFVWPIGVPNQPKNAPGPCDQSNKQRRLWSGSFFRSKVCTVVCLGLFGSQLVFEILEHLP